MPITTVTKYFPDLDSRQLEQMEALEGLYTDWNAKINVVSRKDIDRLYERHVLHSLGIAKIVGLQAGARVMDFGSGGGFPGIPLAILFPETSFILVDSIGKKIRVVKEISSGLGLSNVVAIHSRAEEVTGTFDFIVSRAVTNMADTIRLLRKKINKKSFHPIKNGILALKGGDLGDEMKGIKGPLKLYPLSDFFDEEFFLTKYVVHASL